MNQFNPFNCNSENTRRLSVGLGLFSLLAWVVWVGIVSNGFSEVRLAGWLVFVGAPIATYLALLMVVPILRNATREVRCLVSVGLLWLFLVAAWGYIWDWENSLSFERYLALFVLPPIGSWLGFALWKWTKAG